MLLRSSSTPILSSLLSSNESPNNHHHFDKAHPLKVSFHLSDSSPAHDPSAAGFRRARSDGNLRSLLSSEHKNSPALDSIPSFSTYGSEGSGDGDGEEEGEGGRGAVGGGFGFVGRDQNLNLVDELRDEANPMAAFPLFLARGLGIDRRGSGLLNVGGGGGGGVGNGDGEGRSEVEMYYRRMVEENPSNALFLSNYAKFLYQNKGDAQRAEEYYSRAILADPGDGETLSQYAKLVWVLYRDKERASSYFEQAVRATPNNSHVSGAYASFLWETGDEDEDGDEEDDHRSEGLFGVQVQQEALAIDTGSLM